MSQSEIVFRASTGNPCDVCGSDSSGCSRLADGARFCRGTPLDTAAFTKLADTNNAGFAVYRRTEETNAGKHQKRGKGRKAKHESPFPPTPPTATAEPATVPKLEIDWAGRCAKFSSDEYFSPATQVALAEQLGVPVESLTELPGVGANGFNGDDINAIFPERDEFGHVIGLTERRPNEKPKHYFHPGGSRGLSIPRMKLESPEIVFVVEGATDTLALCGAGIDAVGRPGAEGKTALLAAWLGGLPSDTQIIVVGENDEKADGKTPGRDGAIKVARELTRALGREVKWTLPPVGSKDVRDWLRANTSSRDSAEWLRAGKELRESLVAAANSVLIDDPTTTDQVDQSAKLDEDNGRTDDPATWDCTPDNPLRLAEGFLATQAGPGGELLLRYWRSEYYRWFGGAYRHVEEVELECQLVAYVHADAARVHGLELVAWNRKSSDGRGPAPKIRNVTTGLIRNVVQAFRSLVVLSSSIDAPAWIDGCTGPNPVDLVVCSNGIVDTRTGDLLPPNPRFFTFAATTFEYQPDNTECPNLHKFFVDIWSDIPDQIESLQEWIGYLLTADTSMQKMLFMLGPPRAGKGTIARLIEELVGKNNVISPKLSKLSDNFGLAPLLNKTVATVSDLRLSDTLDSHSIVENLLSITGEDTFTCDRKFLSVVTAKLPTRFVILSNELPRLNDSSGAIYTRMILLRFTESFLGREDPNLTRKLRAELPAIFNWSLVGLRRLRERGRFVQPVGGKALLQQMKDVGSPIGVFVRERCEVKDDAHVLVKELYDRWCDWCRENGREKPGSVQIFGRNLTSVSLKIRVRRLGSDGGRERCYTGIRLLNASERCEQDDSDDTSAMASANVRNDSKIADVTKHCKNQCQIDLFSTTSATSAINEVNPPLMRTGAQAHAHAPMHTRTHLQYTPQSIADVADVTNYENLDSTNSSVKLTSARPQPPIESGDVTADVSFEAVDLYVNRKLETLRLPRGSSMEVIHINGLTHYLVTPDVYAWYEFQGDQLESDLTDSEKKSFTSVLPELTRFVSARYTREEIAIARNRDTISLPELSEVV